MLGLLGVLAFFALILGPIGFFLSLGVGPRVAALERAREHASDVLLRKITDLEQRLRRIEERLAGTASPPIPVSPAAESPTETPETHAPVADVAAVAKAYRAYFKKIPTEGSDYTMDHTAIVYLMDKQGRFVSPFSLKRAVDVSAADLRKHL